jgi:hypothetical protein
MVSTSSMANQSTLKRTRNKTRLAVESMTACTVLATNPGDVNLTAADMSLCYSLMHGGIEDQNSKIIRNSTVLADCFNINQDSKSCRARNFIFFVPYTCLRRS